MSFASFCIHYFFFMFRSEIRLMTQQHAISKEGVTYQELQEMKNKLMALLENNATIYNLVQKYPFGMNQFLILFLSTSHWPKNLREQYCRLWVPNPRQ